MAYITNLEDGIGLIYQKESVYYVTRMTQEINFTIC